MTDHIVDTIERVMRDPRFHPAPQEPSWWQKVQEWIAKTLAELLTEAGTALAGVVSTRMVVVLLALVLVAFLIFLIRNWYTRSSKATAPSISAPIMESVNYQPAWRAHLDAARVSEPALAIQHLQHCLVAYAHESKWLVAAEWKTHGTYLRECSGSDAYKSLMISVATLYEKTLFANLPPSAEAVSTLLEAVSLSCSQEVQHA